MTRTLKIFLLFIFASSGFCPLLYAQGQDSLYLRAPKISQETKTVKQNSIQKTDSANPLQPVETKEYYDSGELKASYLYQNGKKNGPAKTYFKNGTVNDEVIYKNDKLNGSARKYYENGILHQEAFFKNGVLEGKGKIYDSKGQLAEEYVYKKGKPIIPRGKQEVKKSEPPKVVEKKEQERSDMDSGLSPEEETALVLRAPRSGTQSEPEFFYLRSPGWAGAPGSESKKEEETVKKEEASPWEFEAGYETSQIVYKEPTVMRQSGYMQGVFFSVTHRPKYLQIKSLTYEPWLNMFRYDFRYAFGEMYYKGRLSNGTPYNVDDIPDYMIETRLVAGHEFEEFDPAKLALYFGLGYRYLNDDMSIDPAGYERESNYVYIPVGVEYMKPTKDDWWYGGMLEFDGLVGGWQISHVSNVNPGYGDLTNNQTKGFGGKFSLRLQKKAQDLDFLLEPYYRYWYMADSELTPWLLNGVSIGSGLEPRNHSNEYGVRFIARF
ncbi:MAG: toxin-antitoxin system YwqK family antitoxin [Candidatus Omnitrophota bacterium]